VSDSVKKRARDRTRISSKHQVTIPLDAFNGAGFKPGDTVKVEALGPGRVALTRLDSLLETYRGTATPGTAGPDEIDRLRDEWE
jgi:bifunctional DNA-binding transcriptional regulator/antitoxin component of YhaV-PrlF toxin-antitoxin module